MPTFIVFPVALVDVAVSVDQLALSAGFIGLPLALIPRAVAPLLRAVALPEGVLPLSVVDCSSILFEGRVGVSGSRADGEWG